MNWMLQTGFKTERGGRSARQKPALTASLLGFKLISAMFQTAERKQWEASAVGC